MSDEILDGQESLNPEGDQDTNLEDGSDDSGELTKAQEYGKNQKVRAEKAEKEAKDLKAKLAELSKDGEPETPKKQGKSDEPDYAKLAYLKAEGVTHPDDQKIVQDEASRLKLPLTDVLQMEHIKTKLKDTQDQREAQSGAPKGKGKSGGATQQDVDYWLAKGEVPKDDMELANKVIDAKMKKETNSNAFSDDLF